ncbi:MAG: NAD-dependent epimerase/dehydratase family protein [Planctomycetota bacterium]|jgi:dihydroflavonol-4-reductase
MNSERNIFITGASGFIGMNLVDSLALRGNNVYALTRNPIGYANKSVENVIGDIMEPESLISFIKECDVIYHCAAHVSFQKRDFQRSYQINVEGTRNILEAAYHTRVKKIVHLSACAVLGFADDKNRIIDETADPEIKDDNVYAYTKKLAEGEVQKYAKKGLDVSIANIATVYGQGDTKLNSGTIIKSIYEGRMKFVPPGGTSFVSVDDLVNGLILLSEEGKAGERYILCTENMEYKVLTSRIAQTLGKKSPKYTLPAFSFYPAFLAVKGIELLSSVAKGKVNLMTSQILKETFGYKYFSSKKAKEELGWRPTQSFEEAVNKAVNYYKKEHLI